jgi:hypothetical protein
MTVDAQKTRRGIAQGGFQRSALKSLLRGNRPRPGFPLGETGKEDQIPRAAGQFRSGMTFHDAPGNELAPEAVLLPTAVAAALVRQRRGPHFGTCPWWSRRIQEDWLSEFLPLTFGLLAIRGRGVSNNPLNADRTPLADIRHARTVPPQKLGGFQPGRSQKPCRDRFCDGCCRSIFSAGFILRSSKASVWRLNSSRSASVAQ